MLLVSGICIIIYFGISIWHVLFFLRNIPTKTSAMRKWWRTGWGWSVCLAKVTCHALCTSADCWSCPLRYLWQFVWKGNCSLSLFGYLSSFVCNIWLSELKYIFPWHYHFILLIHVHDMSNGILSFSLFLVHFHPNSCTSTWDLEL